MDKLESNMSKINISISPASIITFFGAILLIFFVYKIHVVILLLFASFVIASTLYPAVDWMSKKMRRGLAVTIIYFSVLSIILGILISVFTIIIPQLKEFIKDIPEYWKHVNNFVNSFELIIEKNGITPDYSQLFSNAADIGQDILSKSINLTINLFSGVVIALTIAVTTLFLLLDKEQLVSGYLLFFPPQYKEKVRFITITISKKVGGYIRGQLIIMIIAACLITVGLSIIGMKLSILMGIIAGIFEIVPVIGPMIACASAVIVALAQDPVLALWVILIYLVVQKTLTHIIYPFILGRFLQVHPLIIIFSILITIKTLGVAVVILAPSMSAAISVLVQELYIKRINPQKQETA